MPNSFDHEQSSLVDLVFGQLFGGTKSKQPVFVINQGHNDRSRILPNEYASERNAQVAAEIINLTSKDELEAIFGYVPGRQRVVEKQPN